MRLTHRQLAIVRRSVDDIVALPGGELPREQVASLLIAGIMANNQVEAQGYFDLEGCRRSLETGGWSPWRAAALTQAFSDCLYPSVEAILEARRRKYGWRTRLRNVAFRALVMLGARIEAPPAKPPARLR